jgi:hypothetical protein
VEKIAMLVAALSTLILGGVGWLVAWDLARRAIDQGRNLTIMKTPALTHIKLESHSVPKAESESDDNGLDDPPTPQPRRLPFRSKRKGGGR